MKAYILNIHTATETALVNLSCEDSTLHTLINTDTKRHAAFLHEAISGILKKEKISMKDLRAVGVTSGPGSYTGMRVGLAAAKGICYALEIPLITFNSLELIALSTIDLVKDSKALYCPMIDARRMEVYTAIYNFNMVEIESPSAQILTENLFQNYLKESDIIFSGSGSKKFQELIKDFNSFFPNVSISTEIISRHSWAKYENSEFEKISLAQPLYIKEFYTTLRKLPL